MAISLIAMMTRRICPFHGDVQPSLSKSRRRCLPWESEDEGMRCSFPDWCDESREYGNGSRGARPTGWFIHSFPTFVARVCFFDEWGKRRKTTVKTRAVGPPEKSPNNTPCNRWRWKTSMFVEDHGHPRGHATSPGCSPSLTALEGS